MVSTRPKERSETADALPDNRPFNFVITSLRASSIYAASCNATRVPWVSDWWARTYIRSPPVASNIGIS